jgi:hypothetical protein
VLRVLLVNEVGILQAFDCGQYLLKDAVKLMADSKIEDIRLAPCLVRCGCGRFITPAQDVQHYTEMVGNDKVDFVRDVSLPADTSEADVARIRLFLETHL